MVSFASGAIDKVCMNCNWLWATYFPSPVFVCQPFIVPELRIMMDLMV